MDLQENVTPLQAQKKWNNLKRKYKDCNCPGSGEGVGGKPTAATWPWYILMDEVLGQKHPIALPVRPPSLRTDQGQDQQWVKRRMMMKMMRRSTQTDQNLRGGNRKGRETGKVN
ncbi:hypothetical protein JOB18_020520 [Solea senegalensis]|nr:hypothetical protein JOB18_020520 [Solea senegalensis]